MFPSITHQNPFAPINIPSISFCFHQVPKKFPIKFLFFQSITHQNPFVPIKFPLFPSITHHNPFVPIKFPWFPIIKYQYPFVLIKFPSNSHQIPLIHIKFQSKSFCSHQVPIRFLLFPSNSFCSHQVPIKTLLFPWLWRIGRCSQVSTKVKRETRERVGQSAKRSAAILGQAGRGATVAWQTSAGCGRAQSRIFCLPGFVEDRGQSCFACRASSFICATQERERKTQKLSRPTNSKSIDRC